MSHRTYDASCPYCGAYLDINHDDGYGYEENELFKQECGKCLKIFTYTTGVVYLYSLDKADCLNDGNHKYELTRTIPVEAAVLRCATCRAEKPKGY